MRITSHFGAPSAAVIFFLVLLSYLLDDLILASFLNLPWVEALLTIHSRSEDEIAAMKRGLGSVLGPCLMFGITVGMLKAYHPRFSVGNLLRNFGFEARPSAKVLVIYFFAGLASVILFSKVFAAIFPPPELAAPHPGSVINLGSTLDKLLFVFAVVVLAPIAEEFLFRGVLYSGIAHTWNKPVAAFLVTVIFIFIHPETISSGYWLTHAFLYFVACALLLIRETTDTIFTCIMFHSGVNFAIVFS